MSSSSAWTTGVGLLFCLVVCMHSAARSVSPRTQIDCCRLALGERLERLTIVMPIDAVSTRAVAAVAAGEHETAIMALSCPVPGGSRGGVWSRLGSKEGGASCASDKKFMIAVGAAVVLTGALVFVYCHPKGKEW